MSYSVVSWNIARDSDYLGLSLRAGDTNWSTPKELYTRRQQLLQGLFAEMKANFCPDFFCLQEVDSIHSIKTMALGEEYESLSAGGRDCVLLWNSKRYEKIPGSEYQEESEGRYLTVDLKDRQENKIIRLASAHLGGFDLAHFNEEDAKKGDDQLKALLQILNRDKKPALVLVGMDANSTTEIHPVRIERLTKEGFARSKEEAPTAYSTKLKSPLIKLDFIFARSKKHGLEFAESAMNAPPLETPQVNPSDHKPLLQRIISKEGEKSVFNFLRKINRH